MSGSAPHFEPARGSWMLPAAALRGTRGKAKPPVRPGRKPVRPWRPRYFQVGLGEQHGHVNFNTIDEVPALRVCSPDHHSFEAGAEENRYIIWVPNRKRGKCFSHTPDKTTRQGTEVGVQNTLNVSKV